MKKEEGANTLRKNIYWVGCFEAPGAKPSESITSSIA